MSKPAPFAADDRAEALAPYRDTAVIATKFGFNINPDCGMMTGLNSTPDNIRAVTNGTGDSVKWFCCRISFANMIHYVING